MATVHEHSVQFCDREDHLAGVVASPLAEGLRAEAPARRGQARAAAARPAGVTPTPMFASAEGTSKRAAPQHRILVVDDNEDAASLLAELLTAFGQQTEVAHRAQEALEVARRFEPEVALLDIGLPGVDGFELARQLKFEHRALRLFAVTGYGDAANRALSVDAGFEAHLVKPVQIGDVLGLLGSA